MLTVQGNSSRLNVRDETSVVGTSLREHGDWTRCGGAGLVCNPGATLSVAGHSIRVQGGDATGYTDALKDSHFFGKPGNGIEIWGCHLSVGPGNDIEIASGTVQSPTKRRDERPGEGSRNAVLLRKNGVAVIHDGHFVGSTTIRLDHSELTVYGGTFQNKVDGTKFWDPKEVLKEQMHTSLQNIDQFPGLYFSSVVHATWSTVTIHGGIFQDIVQDKYSSCLYIQHGTHANIYGGNFQGTWYVESGTVTVHGRNLQFVKSSHTKPKNAIRYGDEFYVLSGTLCDKRKISIDVIRRLPRTYNFELKLVNDNCSGFAGVSIPFSARHTIALGFLYVVMVLIVIGLLFVWRSMSARLDLFIFCRNKPESQPKYQSVELQNF
jgi:hypothetical protein